MLEQDEVSGLACAACYHLRTRTAFLSDFLSGDKYFKQIPLANLERAKFNSNCWNQWKSIVVNEGRSFEGMAVEDAQRSSFCT